MNITKDDRGRRVYDSFLKKEGTIVSVEPTELGVDTDYPVTVKFDYEGQTFTLDGRWFIGDDKARLSFVDKKTKDYINIIYGNAPDILSNQIPDKSNYNLVINACLHPKDQVISNSANGEHFKVCRKCKQEVIESKQPDLWDIFF